MVRPVSVTTPQTVGVANQLPPQAARLVKLISESTEPIAVSQQPKAIFYTQRLAGTNLTVEASHGFGFHGQTYRNTFRVAFRSNEPNAFLGRIDGDTAMQIVNAMEARKDLHIGWAEDVATDDAQVLSLVSQTIDGAQREL